MMARLLVKSPCALRSGGIDGSSGVDQALRMKSIDVAGSEREHTAHKDPGLVDNPLAHQHIGDIANARAARDVDDPILG